MATIKHIEKEIKNIIDIIRYHMQIREVDCWTVVVPYLDFVFLGDKYSINYSKIGGNVMVLMVQKRKIYISITIIDIIILNNTLKV